MTPRSVKDWELVITCIEWFQWLVANHSPQQIVRAMKAATETLK